MRSYRIVQGYLQSLVLLAIACIGIACATVGHDSARIGDAEDAWLHGRLSAVNALAAHAGLAAGEAVRASVEVFASPRV